MGALGFGGANQHESLDLEGRQKQSSQITVTNHTTEKRERYRRSRLEPR